MEDWINGSKHAQRDAVKFGGEVEIHLDWIAGLEDNRVPDENYHNDSHQPDDVSVLFNNHSYELYDLINGGIIGENIGESTLVKTFDHWWNHLIIGEIIQSLVNSLNPCWNHLIIGEIIRSLAKSFNHWWNHLIIGEIIESLLKSFNYWWNNLIIGEIIIDAWNDWNP